MGGLNYHGDNWSLTNAPEAAHYGRSPTVLNPDGSINHYGAYSGADAAREDAWKHMGDNDANNSALQSGADYANQQFQHNRGAQAHENAGLAQNEVNARYGHQGNAMGMALGQAQGMNPSQGAYQLQRGLNQGIAQQNAAAAGARGSAALATSGADRNANVANAQQQAWTSGRALAANDMAQGRAMYNGMANQQRQQDQDRLGLANQMSNYNDQANDKYKLGMGQAGVGLAGSAMGGNQNDLGYYQAGMNPINLQDEAMQQRQGWLAGQENFKVGTNQQADNTNSGGGTNGRWVGII